MKRLSLLSISIMIITANISYSQGQYLGVNNIKMYYEIHGKGEPLLLLHLGLGGFFLRGRGGSGANSGSLGPSSHPAPF